MKFILSNKIHFFEVNNDCLLLDQNSKLYELHEDAYNFLTALKTNKPLTDHAIEKNLLNELQENTIIIPANNDCIDCIDCMENDDHDYVIKLPEYNPRNITLFLTEKCNLKCIYCYEGIEEKQDLSFETAKKAIDTLITNTQSKKISITFFGGEPLLKFDLLKKITEYAKQQCEQADKKVHFSMTTNATILSPEIMDFLKEHKITGLLSIDGGEETQNKNRPLVNSNNSFNKIKPNIQDFIDSKQYSVRATVNQNNADLKKTFEELSEMGFGNKVHFTMGAYDGKDTLYTEKGITRYRAELEKLAKYYFDKRIETRDSDDVKTLPNIGNFHTAVFKGLYHVLTREETVKEVHLSCGILRGFTALDAEGGHYLCHRFVGVDEFKVGDVDNGFDMEKITAIKDNIKTHLTTRCMDCWAFHFCNGGCYYETYFDETYKQQSDDKNLLSCRLSKALTEVNLWFLYKISTIDLTDKPEQERELRQTAV